MMPINLFYSNNIATFCACSLILKFRIVRVQFQPTMSLDMLG